MSRTRINPSRAFALSVVLLTSSAALAKEAPSAREIIDRHLAAAGAAALDGIDSIQYHGTFESQGLVSEFDLYIATPPRMLFQVELPNFGLIRQGYDGKIAWTTGPQGDRVLEGELLEQARGLADLRHGSRPEAEYQTIESLGVTTLEGHPEVEGVELYEVRLVSLTGAESFDYYDVESGLRRATVATVATPAGEQESTLLLSDYQPFGDLMVATRLVQRVGSIQEVHRTVENVKLGHVDGSVFELPEEIRELAK